MRTTLSLIATRIAGFDDYLALMKLGEMRTPGWLHLVIDFDIIDERQIVFHRVAVMDETETPLSLFNLGKDAAAAIEAHARAYPNLYPEVRSA